MKLSGILGGVAIALVSAGPLAASAFLVEDIGTGDTFVHLHPDFSRPIAYGGVPDQLHALGDLVVFVAGTEAHGRELWASDGTATGTFELADLCPGACSSDPRILGSPDGEHLLFTARPTDHHHPCRLWRTDGATVEPVGDDEHPGACDETPPNVFDDLPGIEDQPTIVFDGSVYFSHFGGPLANPLYRSDGTAAGTEVAAYLCPGSPCGRPRLADIAIADGSLFYSTHSAAQPASARLFRIDETGKPPRQVAVACSPRSLHPPEELTPLGDSLFFVASCLDGFGALSETGRHLYQVTPDGTLRVVHAATGAAKSSIVAGDGVVYYPAHTGFGIEIWQTDGTPGGTRRAFPGVEIPSASELHRLPDGTFLVRDFGAGRSELDRRTVLYGIVDGSLVPLPSGSANSFLRVIGNDAYYASAGEGRGIELWATGGTPETTRRLTDVNPGEADAWPGPPVRVGNLLFFAANHGVSVVRQRDPEPAEPGLGRELWALPLEPAHPGTGPPPPDEWLGSTELPGFRYQARITPPGGAPLPGTDTLPCPEDTACLAGQVPDRPELFLRVLGPRANGFLWPTIVRFTPSEVEVWLERPATGELRYYRLPAVGPGVDGLPGLQDRTGFRVGRTEDSDEGP